MWNFLWNDFPTFLKIIMIIVFVHSAFCLITTWTKSHLFSQIVIAFKSSRIGFKFFILFSMLSVITSIVIQIIIIALFLNMHSLTSMLSYFALPFAFSYWLLLHPFIESIIASIFFFPFTKICDEWKHYCAEYLFKAQFDIN